MSTPPPSSIIGQLASKQARWPVLPTMYPHRLHKSKGKELQNQRGISIRGIAGDRSQAVSRKGRINIETAFKAESAFRLFPLSGSPQIPIPVQISSYCSPSLI